jgi:hypothetical protein
MKLLVDVLQVLACLTAVVSFVAAAVTWIRTDRKMRAMITESCRLNEEMARWLEAQRAPRGVVQGPWRSRPGNRPPPAA